MATKSKSKPKAGSKTKSKSTTSKIKAVGQKVVSAITGKKSKGGGRRRKRGALWYAKEIQRLKLKKRYEKIKYRV